MRQTEIVLPTEIIPLSELKENQEADFFALLSEKQELRTRDGKPYFRVAFRDSTKEISFPIWSDSPLAEPCRHEWQVGQFYKLRATLQESSFGPQLDIQKIRPVEESDRDDGFDPLMCQAKSNFDPEEMFAELVGIAEAEIGDAELKGLVKHLLENHRDELLILPAAKRNHHAYAAGYLEHVLNVTRTCQYLAEKYSELYREMNPPLDTDLVIAGAILHDIGKLRELKVSPAGAEYTPEGSLVGHILLGRDMIREAASEREIDSEKLLRLEHVILAHQRLPEWGSPKPPMTPEALIVHYADDLDAKLQMMVSILGEENGEGHLTSQRNALGQQLFRGLEESS